MSDVADRLRARREARALLNGEKQSAAWSPVAGERAARRAFAHRLAFYSLTGRRTWASLLGARCLWSAEWGPFAGHLLVDQHGARLLYHVVRRQGPACPHTVELTRAESETVLQGLRIMRARLNEEVRPAVALPCFNL